MSNVLGVDPSLTATGVAWNIGNETHTDTISSKFKGGPQRMVDLRRQLQKVIGTAYPDLIVIEAPAFASKGRSVKEIGGIWWQYRVFMYDNGNRVLEVPPSMLKKYATGRGNAKKIDVVQAAWKRLGYEGTNDNVADALWLHQIGLRILGDPSVVPVPAANTETLKKLK